MVKIEKLSETCIARINGNMIAEGQLFTLLEFRSMFVQSGSVTASIDEKELVTIDAIVLPNAESDQQIVDEINNTDSVLNVEAKNTDAKDLGSLLVPVTKITVPKAKITKLAK